MSRTSGPRKCPTSSALTVPISLLHISQGSSELLGEKIRDSAFVQVSAVPRTHRCSVEASLGLVWRPLPRIPSILGGIGGLTDPGFRIAYRWGHSGLTTDGHKFWASSTRLSAFLYLGFRGLTLIFALGFSFAKNPFSNPGDTHKLEMVLAYVWGRYFSTIPMSVRGSNILKWCIPHSRYLFIHSFNVIKQLICPLVYFQFVHRRSSSACSVWDIKFYRWDDLTFLRQWKQHWI